jgi:transcription antitermination factor NusG
MPQVTREYHWIAIFTKTKQEAAAEGYLKSLGIESFLPRQKVLRQWSDRKKWIEAPLFPNYLFARISCREFDKALQHSSISFCIKIGGYPCFIPDSQIDAIRTLLTHNIRFKVTNKNFAPGTQVEIVSGPLIGRRAEVIKSKGKEELILRLDCIRQNLAIITSCHYVRIADNPELLNKSCQPG